MSGFYAKRVILEKRSAGAFSRPNNDTMKKKRVLYVVMKLQFITPRAVTKG